MGLAVIILAAVYGVTSGLLLPRAVYRLSVDPDEPWRSRCPQGHPLRGWAGPGRCRFPAGPDCAAGPRGGWVGALVGGVCALLGAAVGARPEVVVFVGLAPLLVLLGLVDLAVHRLPDPLTLPLAALTAAGLGAAALAPRAAGSWRLALLGGAALGAGYLVLFLINPAGLGFGDVKLALSLGVALGWYGWGVWVVGAFLGFAYGAVYGLALVLRRRGGCRQAFPFGPFMVLGALTGMLLGGFAA